MASVRVQKRGAAGGPDQDLPAFVLPPGPGAQGGGHSHGPPELQQATRGDPVQGEGRDGRRHGGHDAARDAVHPGLGLHQRDAPQRRENRPEEILPAAGEGHGGVRAEHARVCDPQRGQHVIVHLIQCCDDQMVESWFSYPKTSARKGQPPAARAPAAAAALPPSRRGAAYPHPPRAPTRPPARSRRLHRGGWPEPRTSPAGAAPRASPASRQSWDRSQPRRASEAPTRPRAGQSCGP